MNPSDLAAFNQAIQMAQSGQKAAAYAQLNEIARRNDNHKDPNLLLWMTFTAPSLEAAEQILTAATRIDPHNTSLAAAHDWLAKEKAKQTPQPALVTAQAGRVPPDKPVYPQPTVNGYNISQSAYQAPPAALESKPPSVARKPLPLPLPAILAGLVGLLLLGGLGYFASTTLFKSKAEQIVVAFKSAGLPADNAKVENKTDWLNETNGASGIFIKGDLHSIKFDVGTEKEAGAIVTFAIDEDYQQMKKLLGLLAGLSSKGSEDYIIAFRDNDRMILSMYGFFTSDQMKKYKEIFLNT